MTSASLDRITRSRSYWLPVAAASLVRALLSALTSYLNSRLGRGSADWGDVTFAFIDWLFLGALTPIVYVLARRYPITRERIGRAIVTKSGRGTEMFVRRGDDLVNVGWHLDSEK